MIPADAIPVLALLQSLAPAVTTSSSCSAALSSGKRYVEAFFGAAADIHMHRCDQQRL